MHAHTAFYSRLLLGLTLALLLGTLLPHTTAANAAPSTIFRFEFEYDLASPPTLEGAQLVACDGGQPCDSPQLLATFGQCEGAGCLVATGSEPATFTCNPAACEVDLWDVENDGPYYAVFDFTDKLRVTPLLESGPRSYRTTIQPDGLQLRSIFREPYYEFVVLFLIPAFLFTWIIESVVVWLLLRTRHRRTRDDLLGTLLGWLIPLHMVTIPMVWFFFPALHWNANVQHHQFGLIAAGLLLLVSAAALLYRKHRLTWGIAAGLVLLALVAIPLLWAAGSEAAVLPALPLSPGILTLLAEGFVFAFEACFLYIVGRGRLTVGYAALLSILANAASWGGGELLLRLI